MDPRTIRMSQVAYRISRVISGIVAGLLLLSMMAMPALVSAAEPIVMLNQSTSMLVLVAAPGGDAYLSWWKLLLVLVTFLVWVRNSDWINQDSVKLADGTSIVPQFWNSMNVALGLAGFFAAISIPIFWVGYPLFALTALVPLISYLFVRKKELNANQSLRSRMSGGSNEAAPEVMAQDEGVELSFTPAGDTNLKRQAALIKSRQSPGFVSLKELLYDGKAKRADVIEINYTKAKAAPRLFVDGAWHTLEPMERPDGDAVLVSLKSLAGLNPAERRAQQKGAFAFKSDLGKADVEVHSQGVKTGERVLLKFVQGSKEILNLKELGMFPTMAKKFIGAINEPGMIIVSAPPKHGLSSTWQGLLVSADRLTRDCIGFKPTVEIETSVENIIPKEYDSKEGAAAVLKAAMLAQPDAFAVPVIPSSDVLDTLSQQVLTANGSVWLKINAASAAEALLRIYAQAGNRDSLRQAVKYVSCQRLMRRLCDDCKMEVPVPPKTIKQLGGDPRTQKTIFQQYRLPPPEQRVDEKGKPIEFPTCETCRGLGYIGRIAIFEMIKVNDAVREALKKTPKIAEIDKAAVTSKAKIDMKSGAWQLVLLGVTSIAEVQSTLKK